MFHTIACMVLFVRAISCQKKMMLFINWKSTKDFKSGWRTSQYINFKMNYWTYLFLKSNVLLMRKLAKNIIQIFYFWPRRTKPNATFNHNKFWTIKNPSHNFVTNLSLDNWCFELGFLRGGEVENNIVEILMRFDEMFGVVLIWWCYLSGCS